MFGGANVVAGLSDVGAKNAEFAQRFLGLEKIACTARSLGGDRARRIRFWPTTGKAGQLLLDPSQTDTRALERRAPTAAPDPAAGSVELF